MISLTASGKCCLRYQFISREIDDLDVEIFLSGGGEKTTNYISKGAQIRTSELHNIEEGRLENLKKKWGHARKVGTFLVLFC